jgi:hypothetical protein
MAELKTYKYDWFKIAICAVGLCALVVLMFHAYSTSVAELIEELSADGKSPNRVWLVENLSAAIPVFVVAIVLTIFYADNSKYVPVATQREKLIISVVVAAFTFIGLLSYILMNTGEAADPESGEAIKTLWERTAVWFFAQIIPFMILISYHAIRAESEEKELLAEKEAE